MKTLVKSILVHLSNSRERTMKYMRAIDESLDTVWPIKNLHLSRTCSKASIRWWLRRKLLRERWKRTIFFFSFSFLRCTNSSRREEALVWIIIYITYISIVYIINTLNTWEKRDHEHVSTDYRWHYFYYFYKDVECQTFSLLADYVICYVLTIEILYISKISMIFLCDKSGAIGKKVNAQRDIDYGICFSSSLWKILTSIYCTKNL